MCENTLLALHQVIAAMKEEGPMFLNDLSRSERESFEELFNACETFMNHADELIAAEEELEISPYEDESDCYEQERTSLYR
jgi:lambda repressor-like predicted transcriptional regulator